jgi:hypothetical protein
MGVMLAEIGVPVSHLAPRGSQQKKMNDSSKSFSREEVTLKHELKRPKSRLDLEIQRLRDENQSTPISEAIEVSDSADTEMPASSSPPPHAGKVSFASDVGGAPLAESQSSPSAARTSQLAVVYSLPHQHRRQSLLEVRAAHLAELIGSDGSHQRHEGRREKVKGRRDTVDFSIDRRISDSSTQLASGQTKLMLALFGEHGVVAQELEQVRRASSEESADGINKDVGASPSPQRRVGGLRPPSAAKRSASAPLQATDHGGTGSPVVVPITHSQIKTLLREELTKAQREREQNLSMKEASHSEPLSYLQSGPMYI